MFLNEFADGLTPRDMVHTEEFTSLLASAADLGITHGSTTRYLSRQTVLRSQRFHYTEWGEVGNPPVVLLHGGNQSCHSWDLVSLHLSDRYHVFALDQRGHGDSE
ncbi:MAG: 2-(acetamidomethylene)succinate hydrolase, partial [Acidimicrobiia bacterium]|nr:2-(acetamidomethylene)succinate hydrolase [Acidimicrobiia bacterium]